jgi:sigma-E factor negative regulatory protein RseB
MVKPSRLHSRPLPLWLGLFFTLIFQAFAPTLQALEPLATVDDLLRQLSQSLQERTFRGHLTYEFAGQMESLAVVHGINNGVEQEKILYLSGPIREAVRQGRLASCVNAGSFLLRGGLANNARGSAASVNQNYQFVLRGEERIAGRQAAIIQMVPKDAARYGVTLALDKATGLPLMWMIQNAQRKILERMRFVDIQLDPKLSDIDFKAESQAIGFRVSKDQCFTEPAQTAQWQFNWLPPGFVLAQASREHNGEYLTFTDGLAVFSVRIDTVTNATPRRVGAILRGATLAMVTAFNEGEKFYRLSLTGEIPPETAQAVLSSIGRVVNSSP